MPKHSQKCSSFKEEIIWTQLEQNVLPGSSVKQTESTPV